MIGGVGKKFDAATLEKKIAGGERRLMELSRQILISELVYVLNKNADEVTEWVDKIIATDENISETSSEISEEE